MELKSDRDLYCHCRQFSLIEDRHWMTHAYQSQIEMAEEGGQTE
jgi:hypothetical protein